MGRLLSTLEPRRSESSDTCAATLPDEDCQAEMQDRGEGLTGTLAQDICSNGGSIPQPDTEADRLLNDGESIWVNEYYLGYLRQPKDMDIVVFCRGGPGRWMAVAPEWQVALGFGSTIEEASEQLQSMLVDTKLVFVDHEAPEAADIESIPMDHCGERAREIFMGFRDGRFDAEEKAYFDALVNESSAVEWRTIQV